MRLLPDTIRFQKFLFVNKLYLYKDEAFARNNPCGFEHTKKGNHNQICLKNGPVQFFLRTCSNLARRQFKLWIIFTTVMELNVF